MWFAPSSRTNRTPEILWPLRGPFSQASLKPCGGTKRRVNPGERLNIVMFYWAETNLFDGWNELLWDVGSDGLVFKLQLGVLLWLKRL